MRTASTGLTGSFTNGNLLSENEHLSVRDVHVGRKGTQNIENKGIETDGIIRHLFCFGVICLTNVERINFSFSKMHLFVSLLHSMLCV